MDLSRSCITPTNLDCNMYFTTHLDFAHLYKKKYLSITLHLQIKATLSGVRPKIQESCYAISYSFISNQSVYPEFYNQWQCMKKLGRLLKI